MKFENSISDPDSRSRSAQLLQLSGSSSRSMDESSVLAMCSVVGTRWRSCFTVHRMDGRDRVAQASARGEARRGDAMGRMVRTATEQSPALDDGTSAIALEESHTSCSRHTVTPPSRRLIRTPIRLPCALTRGRVGGNVSLQLGVGGRGKAQEAPGGGAQSTCCSWTSRATAEERRRSGDRANTSDARCAMIGSRR